MVPQKFRCSESVPGVSKGTYMYVEICPWILSRNKKLRMASPTFKGVSKTQAGGRGATLCV